MARADGALVGVADPPCSNTGENQSSAADAKHPVPLALVDFLCVSVPRGNFREPDCALIHALPKDDQALKRALVTMPGLARTYFRSIFPGTSLTVDAFTDKAFQGYRYSADITALGVDHPVGKVAIGGNGNTVFIHLSGSGCAWLREMPRYVLTLEAYGARITRLDCAVDDLHGETITVRELARCAMDGAFKGRGGMPAMRLVDDLGTKKGCSLYIGQKGAKELNVYDKGKQQGLPDSEWRRFEVRLWSKNRRIPYDFLTKPGAVVVGEYPALARYLPQFGASRSQVMKAQSDATVEAATRWLRNAGGKTLDVLRRAADRADMHPADLLNSLSRDGMPRRFASLPAGVVLHYAERTMRQSPSAVYEVAEVERDEYGARIAVGEDWK